MAPKRSASALADPPVDDPPIADSSSEDEDVEEEEDLEPKHEETDDQETDDEEEDEDDEEEAVDLQSPSSGKKSTAVKSDPAPKSTIASLNQSSSSEEEESESESDDAAEEEPVVEKPKPVSSKPKPTVDPPKPKNAVPKASNPSTKKESEKDVKRKSKKAGGGDEEEEESLKESEKKTGDGVPKQLLFQRLWSDEDEIVILQGMIESIKKGIDPLADQNVFLESIKKSLHVDGVNCGQLINKVRRLKKKYKNNFKRAKGGKDPTFSKPHEVKSYELMKQIWGGDGGLESANGKLTSNGKKSKSSVVDGTAPKRKKLALSEISPVVMPKLEEEKKLGSFPCLNESVQIKDSMNPIGGGLMNEGLSLLGQAKVKELEERWKELHEAELEVYLKRINLARDQTMAVLDALKSSRS